MEADKSGRVKFTFEVEINQAAMDLIKMNMANMTNAMAQGMDTWRSRMGQWRGPGGKGQGYGHGEHMGTMMHHGQDSQG